ncbi:MAG TPA: hypothetical protein VFM21_08695 [Terriglobia bacterium]|nr:hypothetical protein [Terriglobia bacterium]
MRNRLARAAIPGFLVLASVFFAPALLLASEVPESTTALVRSRLNDLTTSDPIDLARALGTEPPSRQPSTKSFQNRLQDLGDLDGDGTPEYSLVWVDSQSSDAAVTQPQEGNSSWALFLIAWDGAHWQASPLMSGFQPFMVQALPPAKPGDRKIAVVVLAGLTLVPYPAVFQFRDHVATLAWDGGSDESRYEAFDDGRLSFRVEKDALQMVETGRADPGLLVFPKNGNRGFDARTVYNWDNGAFIPAKTEYTANADYTLYRFIAALHLRDFRAAYGLTDAAKFLKTDKPTLAAFRKSIEDQWPEFLDDKIFHARDSSPSDSAFTLSLPDKVFVYLPEFSGEAHFLSGLTRQEHKPEGE